MKIILSLLILCFLTPNYAQNVYPNYTETNELDQNTAFDPDALNRLYIVGLQYFNSSELAQAEIAFRSIIAFPFNSRDWRTIRYYKGKAHFYLGDIYFIQKNYTKSAEQYQKIAEDYGEIEEASTAIYKLGRSLILDGQEKDGIMVLEDYNINYGSQHGYLDNSLYWIAQAYINLQNHYKAISTLQMILRDFPNSPMTYDVRLLVTQLQNRLNRSEIDVQAEKEMEDTISKTQALADKLTQEKEIVYRITQLLQLKEQLLQIKERKLSLLEKIGQSRQQTLDIIKKQK